jgi:hypothetical protein
MDGDHGFGQHEGRVSFADQEEESAHEGQALLNDAERADANGGCYPLNGQLPPTMNDHSSLPIYQTIHRSVNSHPGQ